MKMPEITKYTESQIRKRLRQLFNEATSDELESGLNWYKEANQICKDYALTFKQSPEVVANVLSALSPRNKWLRNVGDTFRVLDAVNRNVRPELISVCTFNTNKFKAFDIAKNGVTIKKTSPKTHAFVRNIAELDENFVTIDVWHLRACFGETIDTGLTPKKYEQLQAITISEAQKIGLKGYQFQAVVWEVIRNNY